jgi:hypothetical protein
MSRHTYGLLSIAQRHPRLFAAMHKPSHDCATLRGGVICRVCDLETIEQEQRRILRGQPYTWACVPWRTDKPARRRDEPRASRWGDLHG